MAIIAVYLAIFRDWKPYLRRGERAIVLLIASDRVQARILHRYCQGVLAAPLLSAKVFNITASEIESKGGVVIEVVTRDFRSVRGRSVCVAVLDELAMWRAEDSANPDIEVFDAIRASMATFGKAGMVIAGSSPYSRRGVLWEAWRNWHGSENAANLVWQAATGTMNPSVPQEFIDGEYEGEDDFSTLQRLIFWGARDKEGQARFPFCDDEHFQKSAVAPHCARFGWLDRCARLSPPE
jgi:hypothetical protein